MDLLHARSDDSSLHVVYLVLMCSLEVAEGCGSPTVFCMLSNGVLV
jgi:hypothetical protein